MTKSNDEIYDKIVEVEKHVIKTNGSVCLNGYISKIALSLATFLAGIMIVGKIW